MYRGAADRVKALRRNLNNKPSASRYPDSFKMERLKTFDMYNQNETSMFWNTERKNKSYTLG
jgi:hypothetical protein